MSLRERVHLYRQLEEARGQPLVVYVTSWRRDASGMSMPSGVIAADAVPELEAQLEALPPRTEALDLLIASMGGDATVAWRIVSQIRERVKRFAVLIPEAAFSAATLLALGADEIVMHPHANLGPTDPQIRTVQKQKDGTSIQVNFGSQDLFAFLDFVKTTMGLKDERNRLEAFKLFADQYGAGGVAVAVRGTELTESMAQKLLRLHMTSDEDREKTREIAASLSKDFFHHGYPVSPREAINMGLKVRRPEAGIAKAMWAIWGDLAAELELRTPFSPFTVLKRNPACAPLFGPVPYANLPVDLPPQVLQQMPPALVNQFMQNVRLVPPTPYELICAVMESARRASRFTVSGDIVATRLPDGQIRATTTAYNQGWYDVDLPTEPVATGREGTEPPHTVADNTQGSIPEGKP